MSNTTMTERFKKAYDKLIKAYLNGTLHKATCRACAVGNIVGGDKWAKSVLEYRGMATSAFKVHDHFNKEELKSLTGYSVMELALIEDAFEYNTRIPFFNESRYTPSQIDADQFNGLSAVIDVMMKLDGMDDSKDDLMQPFKNKLQPTHP